MFPVGLLERLPDRGGDNGVLAVRDMSEGIAHPVNAAALPGCVEDARDCAFQAGMGVADHKLHAIEAPGLQAAKEGHDKRLLVTVFDINSGYVRENR